MKVIKKIFIAIITIFLVLVFAFNVYNMICIKILKKDLAPIRGYALLEVVSGSMEPTIHIGDIIVINTNENAYKVNDIVTFKDINGAFVTHRILSIEEENMITKGDNNNTEDESMSTKSIIGKYVMKIPGAGKLLAAFKTPFVMIMILIIGLMVCFLISTDKDGKPILTKEEKEFQEFQNNKKEMLEKLEEAKKVNSINQKIKKDKVEGTKKKNPSEKKMTNKKKKRKKK